MLKANLREQCLQDIVKFKLHVMITLIYINRDER